MLDVKANILFTQMMTKITGGQLLFFFFFYYILHDLSMTGPTVVSYAQRHTECELGKHLPVTNIT